MVDTNNKNTIKQGFAAMSKERRREIARKGGIAAHQKGNAYQLTQEDRSKGGSLSSGNFKFRPGLAQIAGRKGGLISRRKKKKQTATTNDNVIVPDGDSLGNQFM